jgi:ankyrin repeat protein
MFCSSKQITALHIAAQEDGLAEMCQLLINAKADVNARDRCAFMFKICC